MYLRRIEIYGFKSFAQKSVLDFDYKNSGNITAVVGPNGSGKSNVADAIRWVTGEQSSKNLRSKKSEDVIFCGSAAKPRGSYAEVTLVLTDDKPVKFELNGKQHELAEIEVARKLYRSGESEYLINRKKVRLTDVQQLLASLGFGQSSYTVIGQGMVDRLLFFTASERKVLFDEAAGVKQYEIKREQSLRKLESTDANLIRLRDILTELEPRVVNLRRLVKRAEGRKELEAEIRAIQEKYYGSLHSEYSSMVKGAETKKSELNTKIMDIEAKLAALALKVQENRDNPFSGERREAEISIRHEAEKRDALREKVAFMRGQIESAKSNAKQAEQRKTQLEAEILELKATVADIEKQLLGEVSEVTATKAKIKNETGKMSVIEDKITGLEHKLTEPAADKEGQKVASLETKQESLVQKKEKLGNKLYALRQEVSLRKARAEQSEAAKARCQEEILSLRESVSATEKKIADSDARSKQLKTEVKAKETLVAQNHGEIERLEIEAHTLAKQVTEASLTELESEIGMVSDVHRKLYERLESAKTEKDFAAIRNEFKDFGQNLDKVITRFRAVTKAVNNTEREKLESLLLEARGKGRVLESELAQLSHELVRLEAEIVSGKEKLADLKSRVKDKETELSSYPADKKNVSSAELETELLADIKKLENEISAVQSEIRKYSGVVSERQNAILREKDSLRGEARELRQGIYNLDMELSRREATLENLKRDQAKAVSRMETIKQELKAGLTVDNSSDETTSEKLEVKERELSRLEEDIAKLRGGLTQIIEKERQFEQSGRFLENERRELESSKVQIQSQLAALDVDFAKATIRLEDVTEEIRVSGLEFDREAKHEHLDQMEKDVLKLKIENIRRKLDNTAGIDPETEAEYHELETRATEMAAQVTDLTKAKEDLTKVVRELDERIKHQFSDIFKNIATEFNRYFTMLFGGGTAKLTLGEDEEGSFGIEISANPPGKRVQSLTALSGGERTLTSLALLFAILSVNPSPFVVLDEVDAALDESNTTRFIKILEDLAKKTQFIIISHNRDTMKCASSLYGVTMDESHISKLLSVKLTEALVAAKS